MRMMNKSKLSDAKRATIVARIQRNYDYDDRTGKLVNRKTGKAVQGLIPSSGRKYYMIQIRFSGMRINIHYHHAVWAWHHGRFPSQIDHIDGDKLNNRIGNLREVTQSENNFNMVHPWVPNPVTGLPGVQKNHAHYEIRIRGRQFYFRDKHQAFVLATLCGKRYSKGKNVKR